jgi:hypothetical protein
LVSGNRLFTADTNEEGSFVYAFDAAAVNAVKQASYNTSDETPLSLAMAGPNLLACLSKSLRILDTSVAPTMRLIGNLAAPCLAAAVSGNTAYTVNSNRSLDVIDVSNPASPAKITTLIPFTPANALLVSGNSLYVATQNSGVLLYDISNAKAPAYKSQLYFYGPVNDLAIDGNFLLMASGSSGLSVGDFTNPARPVLASQTELLSDAWYPGGPGPRIYEGSAIRSANGIAYVGTLKGRVFAVDYSSGGRPRIVSEFSASAQELSFVNALDVLGTRLFVGGLTGSYISTWQFDISQPRNVIHGTQTPIAVYNTQ